MNILQRFIVRVFRIKINVEQKQIFTVRTIEPTNRYVRASGKTTRLADMYIQLLFTTGAIEVRDYEGTGQSDRYLFDTILRRLKLEHSGIELDIRGGCMFLLNHPRYEKPFRRAFR